jgi:membrane fusion protein, macrolide-specific efflux system
MKSGIRWLLITAVAACAGAGIYLSQRGEAKTIPDSSLRIEVERRDLVIEVVDTGKVEPKEQIEIKSKVAGQVVEVPVDEGMAVKKGQLLLRLDPIDYEREVSRAEADVAQAKISLQYAELNMQRKKKGLVDRGVAQIDVDLALNEFESRTVALKSAEIALETARDRLRYTRVASPIDGTVLELGIEKGEVVTPGVQQTFEGRPLLTVGDLSVLIVRCELNQIDVARIQLGQTAILSFDALPGRKFEAKVTKTAPAAVKAKNKDIEVFPVEATLTVVDASIKPGMTADVRFQIETKPNVFSVPIEAVIKREGRSYVNKVVSKDGKETTLQSEVTIGARNDRELEIASGVSEGEALVIDPASSKENEVDL